MKGRPFPVLLGLLLVALVTVLAIGQLGILGGSSSTAKGHEPTAAPPNVPGASGVAATGAVPSSSASEGVTGTTPSSSPVPATAAPIADVPIVPVTNFRAPQTSTTRGELEDVLAGKSSRYTA
ncbi:MAG TPA: hypothetical protein VGQ31_13970, partial [Candidatus Limnocylindrales bacterium]|nr:hypothetical protein [Candidatus Limnocylindrales bacterium]